MEKPSLPKGTRDFGPATMAKRQFIFKTIRSVFEKFGFQPLETPAMENLSTLTGKYGEEGDQLLFRIQNTGEKFLKPINTYTSLRERLKDFFENLFIIAVSNFHKDAPEQIVPENINGIVRSLVEEKLNFSRSSGIRNLKKFVLDHSFNFRNDLIHHIKIEDGWPENFSQALESSRNFSDQIVDSYFQTFTDKFFPIEFQDEISEKGLRYDLTVPFARFVVMNRNEVSFPFKRYQIQPVWRADRPQKGRYREFYQCDADVVGTNSLICEAEIILMIRDTFKKLGITDYSIKINHRGILNGVAEVIGAKGNETALFVAIDKLDKIGEQGVKDELKAKNFSEENLNLLFNILNLKGSITNKMAFLATKFETTQEGQRGLRDLREVFNLLKNYDTDESFIDFDVALARGLSYYTGCIFEVKINNVSIGSVSGGGRYDNLTAAFGDKENLSGVGFSFGVDRIFDAMEELKLFPKDAQVSSKVLICHFDDESMRYGLGVLTKLRAAGIASEIYPDQSKIKKQLDYANKKMIPFTIVIGSDEVKSGMLAFKDMEKGEQQKLSIENIVEALK